MPEISDLLARPAPERFDGMAAWLSLTSEQQAVIGAIALELPLVWHLHDLEGPGPETLLPPLMARVANAADSVLMGGLEQAVRDALPEDAYTGSQGRPRIPSLLGGVCRVCGCSQDDACDEGCGWAAEDLCTACVDGGKSPMTRVRPGTCGSCRWFKPPRDRYWRGRLRNQVPGSCTAHVVPRLRDASCDLFAAGAPIGTDAGERMAALNARMARDPKLKAKCVAGQVAARSDPDYRRVQAAVMGDLMRRPEMRAQAREHAAAINRDPEVRARQWDRRRRAKIPAGMEGAYRRLVRKVGAIEAMLLVHEEAARVGRSDGDARPMRPTPVPIGVAEDARGFLVSLPRQFWLVVGLRRSFPRVQAAAEPWTYRIPPGRSTARAIEAWIAEVELQARAQARRHAWSAEDAAWNGAGAPEAPRPVPAEPAIVVLPKTRTARQVLALLADLAAGAVLVAVVGRDGARRFRLAPSGRPVRKAAAERAIRERLIAPGNDGLFGPDWSQTWRAPTAEEVALAEATKPADRRRARRPTSPTAEARP